MRLTKKQKAEGWRIVKFGDVADQISKRVNPTAEDSDRYIGLEHLDSGSIRISKWGADIVLKGQKLEMKKGDILFAKRNAYLKRVAVAPFDGIFSAHGMVLRPKGDLIIHGFLPFFMQSGLFMNRAIAISEGSLSPTIKWKTLARQEFPLPPRPRQEEMLEVFEKIEDNLFQYVQALVQADRSLSVLRYEKMMKHDGNKQLVSISNLATVNPKCPPNKAQTITFCDMAALDTDSKRISGELIKKDKPSGTRYMNEDVLFARITPCTENGKLALVDFLKDGETGYGSTEFIVLRGQQVDPLYLYHLCRTKKLRHYAIDRMIGTSGRKRVPKEVFDKIMVPLPSNDEQRKILNVLESIEGQKAHIKKSIHSLIEVRNKYLKNILKEAA